MSTLSDSIPSLWPDDIKVDILPPLAILRVQASTLSRITQGLLDGEVTTDSSDSGVIRHHFDVIAPVLNRFRRRILIATHRADRLYPVSVIAECFRKADETFPGGAFVVAGRMVNAEGEPLDQDALPEQVPETWKRDATTQQEFIGLIGQVLQSGEVRSLLQSLIARSNERRQASAAPSPAESKAS